MSPPTGLRGLIAALRRAESFGGTDLFGVLMAALPDVVGPDVPVAMVNVRRSGMVHCAAGHALRSAPSWQGQRDDLPGATVLADGATWLAPDLPEGDAARLVPAWPPPTVGVPVLADGQLVGVLYGFGPRAAAPGTRELLEAVVAYGTLALERDLRNRDLHRTDRQLAKILDITAEIGRQLDFGQIAQHIVDGMTTATDFKVATITLREGDTCRRLAASGIPDPRVGLTTPWPEWQELLQPEWRRGTISFQVPPEAEALWSDVPDIPPSDEPDAWTADHALLLTLLDAEDQIVGFLSVDEPRSGRLPDDRTIETLELFARQVQVALVNARLYTETRRLADRDSLTGLRNRRVFWEDLGEFLDAATEDEPLSLAVIDLDDFKVVNDTHGHAVGDRALRHVADRLRRASRQTDRVYRIGGEEFVLLMPATTSAGAVEVLDRAHDFITRRRLDVPPLTVSAGVAEAPRHATTHDDLFSAADAALYRAKSRGKAMVVEVEVT